MKDIIIGDNAHLDVAKLIESRLLIQANSGGGKSHTVRRLLEQTHGQVQQIVLDPEGEFGTLRDAFDYVLVGKGGDLPADPRSAALLATKLLETGVSAIIDLYELHAQERKRFVRLFLDALVNADKALWHPCMIVVDEAHVFVPEHGEAESAGPVIDLCTRGRKRGFCAVLATQRLSKLHKDAAAECNNKLIGRTGLDIDMKRAADELGFGRDRLLELRRLDPGEFFAYGPAISREVVKVKVGKVMTQHPKIGHVAKVSAPTATIKAALAKLGDLPKEAEAEARTIEQLKRDLAEAKRHRCPTMDTGKILEATHHGVVEGRQEERRALHEDIIPVALAKLKNYRDRLTDLANDLSSFEEMLLTKLEFETPDLPKAPLPILVAKKPIPKEAMRDVGPGHIVHVDVKGPENLSGAAYKMAEVLVAYHPEILVVSRLCALSGYKPKVSTTRNALSILRTRGYLKEAGDGFGASQALLDIMPAPTPMTSEEKIEKWRKDLGGAALTIFDALSSGPMTRILPETLSEMTGIDNTKSTWRNALSQLRVRGLLKIDGHGALHLVEDLFV